MWMVPWWLSLSFQPDPAESEVEAPGAVEVVRPPVSGPWDYTLLSGINLSVKRVPSLLPNNEDELPPLLIITAEDETGGICLLLFGVSEMT